MKDFAIAGLISGRAAGSFGINAFLTGDISTPPISIIDAGVIPGLSIPGIINLGPQLALDVRAAATFDMAATISLPFSWDFPLVDFVFPPEKAPSKGEALESRNMADFKVGLLPGDMSGSIELHIIPKASLMCTNSYHHVAFFRSPPWL